MKIIPAIDLANGRVVRLTKGAFDRKTVYSESPADVMRMWQRDGATLVHVVDLDGAREGKRRNLGSLKNILSVSKIAVQFGGGLRTFESVQEVIKAGVWRAVVGTKAFDADLLKKLVAAFKDRLAVGLDIRDGVIQTRGWLSSEPARNPFEFSKELEAIGVKTIIYTDVSRDGTLEGPNLSELKKMVAGTRMNVIASGGVSDLRDLECLSEIKEANFEGVIVGKALYEQKIRLSDVIHQFQGKKA